MLAIATQGEASRCNRFNGAKTIPLNARNLNKAFCWIACHAEVMFKRNFSRIFNLRVGSAKRRAQPRRCHR